MRLLEDNSRIELFEEFAQVQFLRDTEKNFLVVKPLKRLKIGLLIIFVTPPKMVPGFPKNPQN